MGKTVMSGLAQLSWAVGAVAAAGATAHLFIRRIRKAFPANQQQHPSVPPRPYTDLEALLNILPLAVLLAGIFGYFDVVTWMGSGELTLANSLAYFAVLFLCTIWAPFAVARLRGRAYFREYVRLSEAHSGMSIRGTLMFVSLLCLGLLCAAALLRITWAMR